MHGIKLTVFGMLVLLGALILSAPAFAGMHHDHHSEGSQLHKTSKEKPHHCALLGHSISNPCPHLLKSKRQLQRIVIGPDCGGLPFSQKSIPFPPIQKIFFSHEDLILTVLVSSKSNGFPLDLYRYSTIRSIDHPPQI